MITKEAENIHGNLKNFYLSNAARSSFSHILSCLFENEDRKILMPAYIGETNKEGSGVFDPVRKNGVKHDFYKVREDLSADIENIEELLKSGDFKALLIIHYFGFVQNDLKRIIELCDKYKVIFIEDCAHAFHSKFEGKNIGDWGDVAFFSIHKTIATPDGGFFRLNNDKIGIKPLDFVKEKIEPITLDVYIRSDYEDINNKRINNYKHYLNLIQGIKGFKIMYPVLPDGIIPLNFPIIVENGLREKLYFKLIEKGVITCALYYRMIQELNEEKFPESYKLASSILNLPTHQDTTLEDVEVVVQAIKSSFEELLIDLNQ
ncbi:hypothetical protein P872_01580 [Rhodonellum psychrophilum GCM71 = DSM 17998]|uniref:Aminotransferase DegT n=2 Tax=Rhodonellum TaxID=336827 RepID=U5C2E9_9BACT|nr:MULTISPECIES: DegT/DnrJ/EryC1/StrS family aminotransferase [Rhodonellum]ERM83979.1 hypothetical protein P872_01580 [Rhodonellum psychrophilum GCM71 = DSM 17998]SDZ05926.1 dTDP-4-amino-4,6-dideoxygalactose transaminase [Rhodonellum ikkaensis]